MQERIVITVYVSLTLVFLAIYMWAESLFIWLTREDFIVEWATFLGYFAAAIVFTLAFRDRFSRVGSRAWFLAFLSFGCFFVAGEEISWGQRIFGFETPEAVEKYNFQDELTLHNMGDWGRDGPRRIYVLAIFCYIVLFPIAYRILPFVRKLTDFLHIMLPPGILIVPFLCSLAFPVLTRAIQFLGLNIELRTDYATEVVELFSGFLFLHFSILAYTQGAQENVETAEPAVR